MNEAKLIGVSACVNALGCERGFGKQFPISDVPIGVTVRLNRFIPDLYAEYFKPIDLTRTEDVLTVDSPYITRTIPLQPYQRVNLPPVGLSYATCSLSIYVE